jgi:hypothetical protein
MAQVTLRAQVAALTSLVESLVAAQGAPATAQAKSPVGPTKFADTEFGAKVLARQAAKAACTIHPAGACNRRFSEKSSGATNHVARIV